MQDEVTTFASHSQQTIVLVYNELAPVWLRSSSMMTSSFCVTWSLFMTLWLLLPPATSHRHDVDLAVSQPITLLSLVSPRHLLVLSFVRHSSRIQQFMNVSVKRWQWTANSCDALQWTTSNLVFKVTRLFVASYLINGYRYGHTIEGE